MDRVKNCYHAECGEYCVANGSLPYGNYYSVDDNCVAGGKNIGVYIHLCSEDKNNIKIDIFTEVKELLHCAESYTNITSPSFYSFGTSADVSEASIECLAACQRSDICNY
jgi:hypothetical protein